MSPQIGRTMVRPLTLLALTQLAFQGLSVSVDVKNGVYDLTPETFDTVINRFPAVMVKFYSPTCSHCTAMLPAYEKAARKLKKFGTAEGPTEGARLAKMDATAHREFAKERGLGNSLPKLAIYKDGQFWGDYTGGREKNAIVGYMGAVLQPEPLGTMNRVAWLARSTSKDLYRLLPLGVRSNIGLFAASVSAAIFGVIVLMMGFFFCCRRSSTAAPSQERGRTQDRGAEAAVRGDRPQLKRTTTPGKKRSEGEEKEQDSNKLDQKPKDDAKGEDKKDI